MSTRDARRHLNCRFRKCGRTVKRRHCWPIGSSAAQVPATLAIVFEHIVPIPCYCNGVDPDLRFFRAVLDSGYHGPHVICTLFTGSRSS
ncbi:hypothetical protein EXIGLDRAFT_177832 [Exidia glandulosa HHB12029]|uniref:Uncharacterized protein n=1 Tax=Exidia glandulosa HHB12029 TaxID=1314781 RepID=A0A165F4U8_EXIGL|nr:hypothetical protein EXIGLDRAFT_177832 [Exidia glandulosa HHB12029]